MSEATPKPPSKFAAWIQRNRLLSSLLVVGPVLAALMAVLNFSNWYVQHNWPRPVFVSELHTTQQEMHKLELEFSQFKRRLLQKMLVEVEAEIAEAEQKHKSPSEASQDQKSQLRDELDALSRRIVDLQAKINK